MNTEEFLNTVIEAILEGNKDESVQLAQRAITEKMDLNEVIEKGYIPGIQQVGQLWDEGEYFLPELITSAECMKAAMKLMKPELKKAQIDVRSAGKIVIGSALLTTTMTGQRKFIEILKEKGLYGRLKVMVGGAPVNQKWADEIGADGYSENALTAVNVAKELLN